MNARKFMGRSLGLLACGALSASMAATEADVKGIFFPYASGALTLPGVKAGLVINKANVEQFKDIIDPGTRMAIQNGWYELTVGQNLSFEAHPKYIDETRKNLNKAKLGAKLGEITGYAGGLPFPEEPRADDPRAGEKLAWNFKYNYGAGDASQYVPFFYKFRNLNDGKTERSIEFGYYVQKHKFRVSQAPAEITPNPSNIFRSFYIKVNQPQDIKDTQLLIQRYMDDTLRDDAYLYLGFQRRVRRLATGQTTDPFLGTDLMIEDFEGYNARVSDQTWTYKGTTTMLLPMYGHNQLAALSEEEKQPDGYRYIASTGKGNCFLNVTWQPRKVYIVEGKPTDPSHPIGRRVFYMDAQTFTLPQNLMYDRKGELWKTYSIGLSHPDHHLAQNKGTGVPLFDSFSMVDVQSKHCTVGMIKGQVQQPAQEIFTVQQMRGGTN